MYLKCSVTFQENTCTCILIFYMYFTRIPKESNIHLRYTSDTSKYMYLMRFLDVTLDTYQDTSGYMYLGLFITIHGSGRTAAASCSRSQRFGLGDQWRFSVDLEIHPPFAVEVPT